MKAIQEIITRLNYLEDNGKQIRQEKGDYYWLQEVSKWEDLFTNHPDADKTKTTDTYPWRFEMKSMYKQLTSVDHQLLLIYP